MSFKFISREKFGNLPKESGVYCFKNGSKILYIGKATNIRERVKNHFQQPGYRDYLFLDKVEKVGYIKTGSEFAENSVLISPFARRRAGSEFAEPSAHLTSHPPEQQRRGKKKAHLLRPASQGSTIEALILEANLIKKHQPKYNVVWRDDKNYFFVGVTKEDFPRVFITHQPINVNQRTNQRKSASKKRVSVQYLGPFVDGKSLKVTLKSLRKVFPYRSCYKIPNRPCLWYHLNRCPAPCLSKLSKTPSLRSSGVLEKMEEKIKKVSQRNARNLIKILKEGKNPVLKELKRGMKLASKNRDFEEAAKIRDQMNVLERVISHAKIFEPRVEKLNWPATEKKLKGILKTKKKISRIEAYDVSNIQGQEATGSMITFINGQPDKNFYRKFKIKVAGKPNDIAMLKECLNRRFKHKDWPYPDLILIDGGIAQLNVALKIKNQKPSVNLWKRGGRRERSSLRPSKIKKIKVMSLAKRENKLFIEGKKKPVLLKSLPREVFNLILQLRDEAHRFARKYHLKLREIDFFPKS